MAKKKEVDDETARLLKSIVDHFDDEDRAVRDRQIRQWRRMKLLWENIQHTYYSEVAHDWRVPESQGNGENTDQGFYDKPVNIFRAYLESIIAALSVTVPPVTCYPDDADNPLDITTAKAGDKIAALIFRHNDMPLFWLHALFVFCTEGMTACYTYPKESEEYGTYKTKKYEETDETHQTATCPYCQADMGDKVVNPVPANQAPPPTGLVPITNPETSGDDDEFMPEGPQPINQMERCPECGRMVLPQLQESTLTVTRMVGVTENPKARVCMEVYGGLFVKVPIWARNQIGMFLSNLQL